MSEAFVTLATNDRYALGALVLCSSLKRVHTTRQIVILVTPGVTQSMRDQLLYSFDLVVNVDILDSNDSLNLDLLGRPDLGLTFTKLHCWRLIQFTKCVFLDADTLVLQNVDDLFDREELSAAPDVGWPDCFNSGVFVYRPSVDTYQALLQLALTYGSFDGGDQGLLNLYFNDWATRDISTHLPFLYNVAGQAFYSYLPAYKQYGRDTKIAHFIGQTKPWHLRYNRATGVLESDHVDMRHIADFAYIWWRIFMDDVHHKLIDELASVVETAPVPLVEEQHRPNLETKSRQHIEDRQHQFNWERGQIDYLGIDSFDNILHQIESALSRQPEDASVVPRRTVSLQPSKVKAKTKTKPGRGVDKRSGEDATAAVDETRLTRSVPDLRPQAVDVAPRPSPDDRMERICRTGGRKQGVLTDEGLILTEPGQKLPAIMARDKQQDHVERSINVEFRKTKIFVNNSP